MDDFQAPAEHEVSVSVANGINESHESMEIEAAGNPNIFETVSLRKMVSRTVLSLVTDQRSITAGPNCDWRSVRSSGYEPICNTKRSAWIRYADRLFWDWSLQLIAVEQFRTTL